MTDNILITGANRGLGLEFVRQYANQDTKIFACCREPSEAKDLKALQKDHANIFIYQLDVTSASQIAALAKEISQPIDILISNAGKMEHDPKLGELSVEKLNESFLVNAVAPLKLTEAFISHLSQGTKKLVVAITSKMGSIEDNTSGGSYSYRTGKAALNMLMKSAAVDLASNGIKVLLLHPGWVKTRMGGDSAPLDKQSSISGMRKVIASYQPPSGEAVFLDFKGEVVPW